MQHENISVYLKKVTALLVLLLGYAPVFGLLGTLLMPDYVLRSLLYCALLLPLGSVLFAVRGKWRIICLGLSAVLYTLLVCLLLPEGSSLLCLLHIVPGIMLLFMIPKAAREAVGSEWTVGVWAGGFFAGIIVQMLLSAKGLAERGRVTDAREILLYAFAAYAFLMLMNLNQASMDSGTIAGSKTGISAGMLRRNRSGVVLLFAVALVASMWGKLAVWLDILWQKCKALLRWLIALLPKRNITGQMPGEEGFGGEMGVGVGEIVEKSAFALFMEKVMMFMGYLFVAALLALVLYVLIRQLIRLYRWIREKVRSYMVRAAEDYVDETETIFDPEEVRKLLSKKVKTLLKPAKREKKTRWQDLDGRGKVRYIYRCFYERHPNSRHLTAREALLDENTISKAISVPFADLYDRARYSDHPIDEKDAEKWREKFKY